MKSTYRRIGDFIRLVDERNSDLAVITLLGLSISKEFIPSVANIIGTDMANYKIIRKGQFACSLMQVRRDKKIPVALQAYYDEAIISPAYPVFEIIDTEQLNPEYLMMWMSRSEFDRHACFLAIGGVRGSLEWEDFCDMPLPVPHIDEQREIVKEYNTIVNRIKLNEQVNQKLEETAQAIYKQWFVDFEFPDENGQPYKSSGGELIYNEDLDQEIPVKWKNGIMTDLGEIVGGATPSKTNINYWTDNGISWISPKDLSKNKYKFISKGEFDITKLGYNKCSTKLMPQNSVLFSSRAPIGYLAISLNELCTNQGFKSIIPKEDIGAPYVYYYLKYNTANMAGEATGSTFDEISGGMMKAFKTLVPDSLITTKFSEIIFKIFDIQKLLEKDIQFSRVLKDILNSKMAVQSNYMAA